jgi:hypothetical protein
MSVWGKNPYLKDFFSMQPTFDILPTTERSSSYCFFETKNSTKNLCWYKRGAAGYGNGFDGIYLFFCELES